MKYLRELKVRTLKGIVTTLDIIEEDIEKNRKNCYEYFQTVISVNYYKLGEKE